MRAYDKNHRVRPPVDRTMIVFVARDLSESAAHAQEIETISKYGRIDNGTGCLRNLTNGGEGQCGRIQPESERRWRSEWMREQMRIHPHSKEARERIAAGSRGKKRRPQSEEQRAATSLRFRGNKYRAGKILSEEHKQKIREGNKSKVVSEDTRAKLRAINLGRTPPCAGWNKGIPMLPEIKANLRRLATGRTVSEETRRKRSLALKGRKMPPRSDQWKAKQSAAQRGKTRQPHSKESRIKMSIAAKLREERKRLAWIT